MRMRTRKTRPVQSKNGWKIIEVSGNAYQRGFTHGQLLSDDFEKLLDIFRYELENENHISLEEYIQICNDLARKPFDKCVEWREELEGMVEGALSKGVIVNVDFLFSWNMYLSIHNLSYYHKKSSNHHSERCSAFIATGDATKDGKIVMAHNTHSKFMLAPLSNIIQYVKPDKGNAFIMQTGPGLLCSSVDWFVCDSGIIGCETTIGSINYIPKFGKPYFCRIRECMQYANTLDDCVRIMREDNAGDYPCGWLLGDTNTNEIMLLEVAKTVAEPRRTNSGVFYGSNYAQDRVIRETQTKLGKDQPDLSRSDIARSNRLEWLLNKTYWGQLDAKSAKRIISDHYDVYHEKTRMGSRSICKHIELETEKSKRPAKYPFGAFDGKVVTTDMAKKMTFLGRWGSSCGRKYVPSRTIKNRNRYVPNFRSEPWVLLCAKN